MAIKGISQTSSPAEFQLNFMGGLPGGSDGKESACSAGVLGSIPGKSPLEKDMATHSSILAWRIP